MSTACSINHDTERPEDCDSASNQTFASSVIVCSTLTRCFSVFTMIYLYIRCRQGFSRTSAPAQRNGGERPFRSSLVPSAPPLTRGRSDGETKGGLHRGLHLTGQTTADITQLRAGEMRRHKRLDAGMILLAASATAEESFPKPTPKVKPNASSDSSRPDE